MALGYEKLIELADLDTDVLTMERSRGALPARVALDALREEFAGLERARQLLEPERAPLSEALSALEQEVAQLSERKSHIEARLSSATGGGKELEAMHTEARHLSERMSALEEQELELMEQLEPLEERLAALRAEGAPMVHRRDELLAQLAQEEEVLDVALSERRAQREQLVGEIDPSLLARYEKIAQREGTGAARLEHGTCAGCHLSLPAAELDRLRHLDIAELSTCEQCERLLFRPDQLAS